MKKLFVPLREKVNKRLRTERNVPIVIYIAISAAIIFSVFLRRYHEDLSLNLVSEIIGAAFIIFVIDVLLVKSKSRRWLVVQEHVDYLIARNINRLRDGIATRVFHFQPSVQINSAGHANLSNIRKEREELFQELSSLQEGELAGKFSPDFFSEDNYRYFNEKADDIWAVLNMKYSEYLAPQLVSLLMELHTNLKDICSYIRFYKKGSRFPVDKDYYESTALLGSSKCLKDVIRIVIQLKDEGYSETAKGL